MNEVHDSKCYSLSLKSLKIWELRDMLFFLNRHCFENKGVKEESKKQDKKIAQIWFN